MQTASELLLEKHQRKVLLHRIVTGYEKYIQIKEKKYCAKPEASIPIDIRHPPFKGHELHVV